MQAYGRERPVHAATGAINESQHLAFASPFA